jgi:putative PIN family toxin of toxin-antitoxin system
VFTPLVSKQVLEDYIRVLSYPKFNLKHEEIDYIIKDEFLLYSEPVKVNRRIDLIKDDPEDNKFLSLSASGKADYIVSGDRHILDLKDWKQGSILSVREFLAISSSE